jgi:hypothetical protein
MTGNARLSYLCILPVWMIHRVCQTWCRGGRPQAVTGVSKPAQRSFLSNCNRPPCSITIPLHRSLVVLSSRSAAHGANKPPGALPWTHAPACHVKGLGCRKLFRGESEHVTVRQALVFAPVVSILWHLHCWHLRESARRAEEIASERHAQTQLHLPNLVGTRHVPVNIPLPYTGLPTASKCARLC